MTGHLLITVVLSTRHRASMIQSAVRTILENDHPDFEVIVVDQSDDDRTEAALDPFFGDPRLRYLRSATRGRSAGLNAGTREARGALILFTDDDCRVPIDWVRQIDLAFGKDDHIGMVFGNVVPALQNSVEGCIPAYVRQRPFLACGIQQKHLVEGMGACMAVRRKVWQSLNGFDEMLGAGSRFKAGEDGDLALRALLAGHWIYETPAVSVTHYGLRNWEQLPALFDSYWHGTGAMMAKPLKIAPRQILPLLLWLAVKWVRGHSTVGMSLGRRPRRLLKLRVFCQGFLAGAMVPVNRETGLFLGLYPEPERIKACVDQRLS
jgi:glycosyltransferase involved in cell wall biosynthesis